METTPNERLMCPSMFMLDEGMKEQIVQRLEEALRRGCTNRSAASVAGISYDSLYKLLRDNSVKERLFNAALSCRMKVEHKFTEDVLFGDDWRARESWLKRRARDEWGDSIDVRKLDDGELLRLYHAANPELATEESDLPILDSDFLPELESG